MRQRLHAARGLRRNQSACTRDSTQPTARDEAQVTRKPRRRSCPGRLSGPQQEATGGGPGNREKGPGQGGGEGDERRAARGPLEAASGPASVQRGPGETAGDSPG